MNTKKPSPRVLVIGLILFALLLLIISLYTMSLARKATSVSHNTSIVSPPPSLDVEGLPQDFPTDMPVIPQSKVTVASDEDNQVNVVLLTAMGVDDVYQFYLDELPKKGWEISNESKAAGLTILYADKSLRRAIITIGKSDLGITVSLTLSKNE